MITNEPAITVDNRADTASPLNTLWCQISASPVYTAVNGTHGQMDRQTDRWIAALLVVPPYVGWGG